VIPSGDGTDLKAEFERLESAKASLVSSLASLDAPTLNRKPDPATWSIVQVIFHLTKSEGGTLQYIRKKTQDPSALPKAGLLPWLRVGALVVGIESPFKFKAPGPIGDVPESADPAEALARWAAVRDDWRGFVAGFPPALNDRVIFRHPFVGLLGPAQVMIFLRFHLKNHTRQIGRIRNAIGA